MDTSNFWWNMNETSSGDDTSGSQQSELDYWHSLINNNTQFVEHSRYQILRNVNVQTFFGFLYVVIFVIGLIGNFLVCFIVLRNKPMQTVTNIFISNLALADICLCLLCVPFTPLYYFIGEWVFGSTLCKLLPFSQGVAIYISTLTLTAIAVDRYFVIIYPFKERMKVKTSIGIIAAIWVLACVVTLPYGLYTVIEEDHCIEMWPSNYGRYVYGISTVIMQFMVPFAVITYCYVRVSLKLRDRARMKAEGQSTSSDKEKTECKRKRRTNRMLIAMVVIFGVCWLPINLTNLTVDMYYHFVDWQYFDIHFLLVHVVAMSSTCYNPFLYSWLNKNFRKQFRKVLPCFENQSEQQNHQRLSTNDLETTCNDNTAETTLYTNVCLKSDAKNAGLDGIAFNANNDVVQLRSITSVSCNI